MEEMWFIGYDTRHKPTAGSRPVSRTADCHTQTYTLDFCFSGLLHRRQSSLCRWHSAKNSDYAKRQNSFRLFILL